MKVAAMDVDLFDQKDCLTTASVLLMVLDRNKTTVG